MSKTRNIVCWVGVVIFGLAHGLLEDLLFISILVPYMPPSWDLTGDLFFVFTVPLAQLMAFALTGTIGWFLLDLRYTPRLILFWALWSLSRTAFLLAVFNPFQDILIYLLWIALWCVLYWLLAGFFRKRQQPASAS